MIFALGSYKIYMPPDATQGLHGAEHVEHYVIYLQLSKLALKRSYCHCKGLSQHYGIYALFHYYAIITLTHKDITNADVNIYT